MDSKQTSISDEGKWRKYYKVFEYLPLICAGALLVLFFIWGIVDASVFVHSIYVNGKLTDVNGVMYLPNGFLCWLVWMVIGGVAAAITYFLGKVIISYKIMHIIYLDKIYNSVAGQDGVSPVKEQQKPVPAAVASKPAENKSAAPRAEVKQEVQKPAPAAVVSKPAENKSAAPVAAKASKPSPAVQAPQKVSAGERKVLEVKGVKEIERMAYYKNEEINSLVIGDDVEKIGDYAFTLCKNLETVTLGAKIKHIGECAFLKCDKLKEINYGGTISEWEAVEKMDKWNGGTDGCVVHCTDGDI